MLTAMMVLSIICAFGTFYGAYLILPANILLGILLVVCSVILLAIAWALNAIIDEIEDSQR